MELRNGRLLLELDEQTGAIAETSLGRGICFAITLWIVCGSVGARNGCFAVSA